MPTFSPPISMPISREFILTIKSLIYKLNKILESEHPCLKPQFTSNHSVSYPFILTEQRTLSYIDNRALYINPEMPKFESFVNRIPLSILSNAFLKSIKAAKVAFCVFSVLEMYDFQNNSKWFVRIYIDSR